MKSFLKLRTQPNVWRNIEISPGVFKITGKTFNANSFDFRNITRKKLIFMMNEYGETIIDVIKILKDSQSSQISDNTQSSTGLGARIPVEEIMKSGAIRYYADENDNARSELYRSVEQRIKDLANVSIKITASPKKPTICFTGKSGMKLYFSVTQLKNNKISWSSVMKTLKGHD